MRTVLEFVKEHALFLLAFAIGVIAEAGMLPF